MKIVDKIQEITKKYLEKHNKTRRKEMGQFFTSSETAIFMANMFDINKEKISILDPGAGTGILAAALCERLLKENCVKEVYLDLYENNNDVIETLEKSLFLLEEKFKKAKKTFNFNIKKENFITFNKTNWENKTNFYDLIISNPPYKKISKNQEESLIMDEIVYGQPNMYALFLAMSANLLNQNGELVFIIPRSFTSGAYFKKFRQWLLMNLSLNKIHIFISRDQIFKNENVLQETIILKAVKNNDKSFITVSETFNNDYENIKEFEIPYNLVVQNNDDCYILIPTDENEIRILNDFNNLNNNLITLGFKLKTGPVVHFRALESLEENEKIGDTYPLLWPYNIEENRISFPFFVQNKPQYINGNLSNLLLENKNYLVIKRFTTKEENRRIQVAMHLKVNMLYSHIGIENHLNYITKIDSQIENEEFYGLFAFFNTSYVDKYYRILNGSTQVNASEVNKIPLPTLDKIKELGRLIIKEKIYKVEYCDSIVERYIFNKGELKITKLEDSINILKEIGMPKQQYNERSAYVLLSLAGIRDEDDWTAVTNNKMRIVDIMNFMAENYNKIYKPNTRETIRKDTIHQFRDAAIIESNSDDIKKATNSPSYYYSLTTEMVDLLRTYGTNRWDKKLENFKKTHGTLIDKYSSKRELARIPVRINGEDLTFSPGDHNQLQKHIIEDFASIFAQGAEVLYVGDTDDKYMIKNSEKLFQLGINLTKHDKLPDVVLYLKDKNWLYFIESVTSVGPISQKRMNEINTMTEECNCGKIFVTAFLDRDTFRKFMPELAWETEVWIAQEPEHMIHLNGDRFLGPR